MTATSSSAGISDQTFIQIVREDLDDPDVFAGVETATADGTATAYRVYKVPIYDGDAYGTSPGTWKVYSNNVLQTLVDTKTALSAGTVYVNYQTGWIHFGTTPSNGHVINVTHSQCRWTDRRILKELQNGLRAMFPKLYQYQTDTSLQIASNTFEYTLPSVFFDPRVRIMQVEIQGIPATTSGFYEISGWRRVGTSTLRISGENRYTPSSTLRIHYTGPYQSLGELEAQAQNLPVLYAKGMLLLNKEGPRASSDSAAITQTDGANPIGSQANVGLAYLKQFNSELERLTRNLRVPSLRSVYDT